MVGVSQGSGILVAVYAMLGCEKRKDMFFLAHLSLVPHDAEV